MSHLLPWQHLTTHNSHTHSNSTFSILKRYMVVTANVTTDMTTYVTTDLTTYVTTDVTTYVTANVTTDVTTDVTLE